jgi:hypothetical protein
LANRPFDMALSAAPCGDASRVRKIRLYCAESGMSYISTFDLVDPLHGGERSKLLRAAAKRLLQEVKSRLLANQDFTVWFYDRACQAMLEDEAAAFVNEEPVWQRALDKLKSVARVVGEANAAGQ